MKETSIKKITKESRDEVPKSIQTRVEVVPTSCRTYFFVIITIKAAEKQFQVPGKETTEDREDNKK